MEMLNVLRDTLSLTGTGELGKCERQDCQREEAGNDSMAKRKPGAQWKHVWGGGVSDGNA